MIKNKSVKSFPYPEKIFDNEGYPTQEALDYIKNWSLLYNFQEHGTDDPAFFTGQYFGKPEKISELIDYIKQLFIYENCVEEHDNYLEIHTFGWSGNESVVEELKRTFLWQWLDMTFSGGHYFFKKDRNDHFNRVFDYIMLERLEKELPKFMKWAQDNHVNIYTPPETSEEAVAIAYLKTLKEK